MNKVCKDYLWITVLIMIICWGFCVLCTVSGYAMNEYYVLYIPWILGGVSPTIASYIAQKKNGVVSGLKEWLKKVFDVRQKLGFYVLAILIVILGFVPQCLIAGFKIGMPIYFIAPLLPLMLIGGGLEEAGWRMILQPELEKKYCFIVSSLIVSIIWWLWHLPLFFIQGTSQFGTNFFFFGISTLALSFGLAAIKKVTGSVFLCVFAHSLNNALCSIFLFKGTLLSYCVTDVVIIAVSIILVRTSSLKNHNAHLKDI